MSLHRFHNNLPNSKPPIEANQVDWAKIKKAGIVGVPPRSLITRLNRQQVTIYDLDEPLVAANPEAAELLPGVYCAILRTVCANARQLPLDAVFIDTGAGKCDGARYTARLLAAELTIPVVACDNQDRQPLGNPLCRSALPLPEKMQRITAGVKLAQPPASAPPSCPPRAGFWGVPPRDFSLLELFPAQTHIYGWTRCMENKTPADHDLESHFNPEIPTVFYAQSFCPKTALARFLAARHPMALYLDADQLGGGSARAKIQAFFELTGAAS
ncbi:hypothetical protein [Desulfurivibrio alkaliphilus]|uniref:Uncharacterized protein n=1 Tax=Desulfurivibrio alkaliphilus (strain DSM 19089 / UNIQEM U267 / AHT2) TaxID=589865 RepID=D6Z3E5_DESAT|nr:hypothetical protein [Desulfurivibrio alkaliphilus]ADH86070.1 hypothetical protein DaAHT2_1375 [Desulfurivibrio alkaliphilus AHT 2]